MFVVITYDVNTESKEGKDRLRKVAKICTNYGQRVQNSVFECILEPSQYKLLQSQLEENINIKTDSIRIYHISNNFHQKIIHIGKENIINQTKILIV